MAKMPQQHRRYHLHSNDRNTAPKSHKMITTIPSLSSSLRSSTFILSTILFLIWTSTTPLVSASSYEGDIGGRYSFSLTTFDPSGKLSQVSHATRASTLGPPIIALTHPKHSSILFCTPHALPSPLVRDDGTGRFTSVSSSISLCHSGIGADGRVVVDAALKCAIEHLYTYDEEVPIDVFLETLSLLFQEYTMKAGCRPFGCCVLVCYLPPSVPSNNYHHDGEDDGEDAVEQQQQPCIYRIDPSGAVELMVGGEHAAATSGASIAFIGQKSAKIAQGLTTDLQLDEDDPTRSKFNNANTLEEAKDLLVQSFRKHLGWEKKENYGSDGPNIYDGEEDEDDRFKGENGAKMSNAIKNIHTQPLLVATMTRKDGLKVQCDPPFSTTAPSSQQ